MQKVNIQFREKSYRSKEAFKTLRTNIEFCGEDIKVIAVTSCTPNEGKSSIAMELAKSFGEAGYKVLLVDADLRKSVLVGRYKTGAVKLGLTHYLIGRKTVDDVLCKADSPNLYMVFSGPIPPNPSELIGCERFTSFIEEMRDEYDYIIVDTPPLGSVIDAAIASRCCDGTIWVIESNAISYRFAQSVKAQMDKTGGRILGVILNKVDMSGRSAYGHYGRYYGKYYGKYYGQYGREESQAENVSAEAHEDTQIDGDFKMESID